MNFLFFIWTLLNHSMSADEINPFLCCFSKILYNDRIHFFQAIVYSIDQLTDVLNPLALCINNAFHRGPKIFYRLWKVCWIVLFLSEIDLFLPEVSNYFVCVMRTRFISPEYIFLIICSNIKNETTYDTFFQINISINGLTRLPDQRLTQTQRTDGNPNNDFGFKLPFRCIFDIRRR